MRTKNCTWYANTAWLALILTLLTSNICGVSTFAPHVSITLSLRRPSKITQHRLSLASTTASSTANSKLSPSIPCDGTTSVFLTPDLARKCVQVAGGTPLFAYCLTKLAASAKDCLAFPNAYGLTVRYAMKACPNRSVLQYFHSQGIHVDASSGYEVRRALSAGIPPNQISLSTQELPQDFAVLMDLGVNINACSLSQLQKIGIERPGSIVGVRVNPGVGSGGFSKSTTSFSKTNVGGPSSSFGIWHELVRDEVPAMVKQYDLTVERIHTHIGSGSDPDIWQEVAKQSLSFCALFETVKTLNLGGGFKVGRNQGEPTTDLQKIGDPVRQAFVEFAQQNNGRELHMEIEPGTYLVAMAGALVATVQDKVHTTGDSGHVFLKLDAGMTDVLRPSLYGAIHPMTILPRDVGAHNSNGEANEEESVVVVGHCCESGDLLTPLPGQPDDLAERTLRKANIGDLLVVDGSGAYCSGMSTKNYNSFPEAPEVMIDLNGTVHLIRKRQELNQIFQNEVELDCSVFEC